MGREWKVDDAQRTQPSTRPDVLVARRAAEEWGVLSFDEVLACGLSPRGVVTRCRNGRLHRLYRGVYAVGHGNPPLQGRFLAAVKACGPHAVVSHFSAAALWGCSSGTTATRRSRSCAAPSDHTAVWWCTAPRCWRLSISPATRASR